MSMRIERTIEVYLSTRQKILSNLAAGLRQTVDDIPGIVRESCGGDEPQDEGYSLSNRKKSGEQVREM